MQARTCLCQCPGGLYFQGLGKILSLRVQCSQDYASPMTVLLVTSWWRCSAWWSSGARNISEWGWVGFRPRESVSRWNLLNDDVFMTSQFLLPQRQDFCAMEPTVPTIFSFTALRHHRYLDTLLNVYLLVTACSRILRGFNDDSRWLRVERDIFLSK